MPLRSVSTSKSKSLGQLLDNSAEVSTWQMSLAIDPFSLKISFCDQSNQQDLLILKFAHCDRYLTGSLTKYPEVDWIWFEWGHRFGVQTCRFRGTSESRRVFHVCDLRRSITHKCWPSSLWNVVFTWKMRVPYLPAPAWCHPICGDNYWPDRYFRWNISRQGATLIVILQRGFTLNVITRLFMNGFHWNWNCSIAGKRLYRKSFGLDSIKGGFRRQICISRER
jgi:hypothetical protein